MKEKKTLLLDWKEEIKQEELEKVKEILNRGGVIIFPTDTVYGIGCNAFDEKAIDEIFKIKNRPKTKPINVLTDKEEKIEILAETTLKEKELIRKYMPGALTIILKKKESLPSILTSGLDTVGVRIPNNMIANEILGSVEYPLATTSANESGEQDGVSMKDLKEFIGKVDAIIDGGKTKLQIASTIIKVEEEKVNVLRQGSIKITD